MHPLHPAFADALKIRSATTVATKKAGLCMGFSSGRSHPKSMHLCPDAVSDFRQWNLALDQIGKCESRGARNLPDRGEPQAERTAAAVESFYAPRSSSAGNTRVDVHALLLEEATREAL